MTNPCIRREAALAPSAERGARPSYGQRLSKSLFGSPSFSRANGARSTSIVSRRLNPEKWALRCEDTPVYLLDESKVQQGGLPDVWITEAAYDESYAVCGREYVAAYPSGQDPRGKRAFGFAMSYFGEALSYSDSEQDELKTECYRAAELLFLHAAQRGSVDAYVKLGVIYANDLCDGAYFHRLVGSSDELRARLANRALECFSYAAAHDNAEACWQYADLGLRFPDLGINHQSLHMMCERALQLGSEQANSVDRGNAALRLARMHEAGIGCEHSFKRAYAWYRIAEEELCEVVSSGAWYFKRARLEARKGVLRMRQELLGSY